MYGEVGQYVEERAACDSEPRAVEEDEEAQPKGDKNSGERLAAFSGIGVWSRASLWTGGDGRASGTQLDNGWSFALPPTVAKVGLGLRRSALSALEYNHGTDESRLLDAVLEMDPGRDLGMFGPRTLPSLAYSHARPRDRQRAQDGCSPEHCTQEGIRYEGEPRNPTHLCLPGPTLFTGLCGAEARVLRRAVEKSGSGVKVTCEGDSGRRRLVE